MVVLTKMVQMVIWQYSGHSFVESLRVRSELGGRFFKDVDLFLLLGPSGSETFGGSQLKSLLS